MLDSVLVYAGLVLVVAGIVSLVRPLRVLRVRTRPRGALVTVAGVLLMIAGFAWPVGVSRVEARTTRLDEFMPEWQFSETHRIRVAAPPERVFAAIRAVTADDIALFELLTTIRRGGRSGPEDILNAPGKKPLLEVATSTTFLTLADDSPRELVVGTVIVGPASTRTGWRPTPEIFHGTPPPGVALATMNFIVVPDSHGGSRVSTETRVYAADGSTARRFAIYWRIIHPGSDIIRRMWLRAIKRRAEGSQGT